MSAYSVIQPSFAAGELSPFLFGRVDLAKFRIGARTMRNFFVHPHGGASNRPGTRFVGAVADSTQRHRLIPFRFRTAPSGQNYALVFGHHTMQVAMMGSSGIPGFVESSPGTRFTLATPYAAADLARLKYVQSADTMTLTHPNYAPRTLTRTGHASWQLTPITFAPRTPAPTGLAAASPGSAVSVVVTAINDSTGEESLPSEPASATSSSASWSWTPVPGCSTYNFYRRKGSLHGFVAQAATSAFTDTGDSPDIGVTPPQQRQPFAYGRATGVTITAGGSGYTSPTGKLYDGGALVSTVSFTVAGGVITAGTLQNPNQKINGSAHIAISDGAGAGAAIQTSWTYDPGNPEIGVPAGWRIAGFSVLAGGAGYHSGAYAIWYNSDGTPATDSIQLGLAIAGGAITAVTFTGNVLYVGQEGYLAIYDSAGSGAAAVPTLSDDPATWPQCSTYYQQRQVFAATIAEPQALWFSDAGAFNNMAVSQPTRDSDAITRSLTGRQVNEIRHLVPVGGSLLVMTSGAEWRCWPGPNAAALTPSSCATVPQTAYGSSHVPPIEAGGALLFVQERGSRVRELRFDALQDQYQAADLSILADHLMGDTFGVPAGRQYAIEEWAFAEEPFRIVWAVRSDGQLLGFTYMREHEVYAWHRHDTAGSVESVCTLPEADGDSAVDATYLIVRRIIEGNTRRYLERLAPRRFATIADAWFLDCALAYDGAPTTNLTGLGHLEGCEITVLADGAPQGPFTVSDGAIELDAPCSRAIAGLAYSAELETLNLEPGAPGQTVQGRLKKISKLTVRVKDTSGLKAGFDSGTLRELRPDPNAVEPVSGDWAIALPGEWNRDGRLTLSQERPLPCTVLDVIPELTMGG